MKFDLEKLLVDLDAYFKANLNTKIAAINSEKNDSIALEPINAGAFILWSNETINKSYDRFILIQPLDVVSNINGPYVSEQYSIEVLMFLQENYNRIDSWKEVLRYWRAIKEVGLQSWDKVAKGMQADVTSLAPISFSDNQSSTPLKVFGVRIDFTIA
jgi:hypothetical protein